MWRKFMRNLNASGADKISGDYLKHNVPSGIHLRELNRKQIHNKRHAVCSESHANVAEIILDKQVETTSTVQVIQTKSETGTSGEVQIAQHACEGHQICWNASRTLQVEINSSYKKIRSHRTWRASRKTSTNLVVISHVSGSP
jgi:hypothetical protein